MQPIKTLTPAVADILNTAPLLRLTVQTDAYALGLSYPRSLHEHERAKASRELGAEILKAADVETGFDGLTDRYRTEYRVFAMNQADLAILLTRAFEAGRRAK